MKTIALRCMVVLGVTVTACNTGASPAASDPPMVLAASQGQMDVIKAMVATGADVNVTSPGFTPLCAASARGHQEIAEYLIAQGATINTTNVNGYTPLYWAISGDHKDVMRLLLDKGADVHVVSLEGRPLALARSADVVQMLLDKGAAVNVAGDKRPPLHVAAYHGNLEVAQVLLAKGAEPNATNAWGASPLHEAARSEEPSAAMAILLITHGANVNATDAGGGTPLHTAVKGFTDCMDGLVPFWIKNRIMKERLKVADVLLARGADINATNRAGQTPLAQALAERNSAASKFLVRHGATQSAGQEHKAK